MSVSTLYFPLSMSKTKPIATPPTCAEIGTPASIKDNEDPQVEAIEVDPLDESTSETSRMVYGNFSLSGKTGIKARSARAPWPISLRLGPLTGPVSPTEKLGKL